MGQKGMIPGLPTGTRIRIIKGSYARSLSAIEGRVYGDSVDFSGLAAMGSSAALDDGEFVIVRQDQVIARFQKSVDHRD